VVREILHSRPCHSHVVSGLAGRLRLKPIFKCFAMNARFGSCVLSMANSVRLRGQFACAQGDSIRPVSRLPLAVFDLGVAAMSPTSLGAHRPGRTPPSAYTIRPLRSVTMSARLATRPALIFFALVVDVNGSRMTRSGSRNRLRRVDRPCYMRALMSRDSQR